MSFFKSNGHFFVVRRRRRRRFPFQIFRAPMETVGSRPPVAAERPVVARVRWREDVLSISSGHASGTHTPHTYTHINRHHLFLLLWVVIFFPSPSRTRILLEHKHKTASFSFGRRLLIFVFGERWTCDGNQSFDPQRTKTTTKKP